MYGIYLNVKNAAVLADTEGHGSFILELYFSRRCAVVISKLSSRLQHTGAIVLPWSVKKIIEETV